jgi:hydroxymethylpyrimidine/phosphomethylpyrimidine kinase
MGENGLAGGVKLKLVENPSRPIALTIAGFDPSSGAGVTADLKTFAAHGVYGVACISALTVQSTQGVRGVEVLQPGLVRRTLDYLADDFVLAGVKIGMLGSAEVAAEVCAFLALLPPTPIVLDPVLCSSSGAALIDPDGVKVVREALLPQVGWVTPNLDELEVLAGEELGVEEAAARLQNLAGGGLNVVVTGGHLSRPDDFLLTAAGEESWFRGERILTKATHGTGCAFSSALLCGLIAERSPQEAVGMAKAFVTEALRSAYPMGKGNGPMNHLFRLP